MTKQLEKIARLSLLSVMMMMTGVNMRGAEADTRGAMPSLQKNPDLIWATNRPGAKNAESRGIQVAKRVQLIPGRSGETKGWIVEKTTGKFPNVLRINVTEKRFKAGRKPNIQLYIEYLDAGKGTVAIKYDSSDTSFRRGSRDPYGVNKIIDAYTLKNSQTWKVALIPIEDAFFENRCKGNDILVQSSETAPVIIRSIAVKALPTPKEVPIKYVLRSSSVPGDVSVSMFSVRDFGALPNDRKDDTDAFQRAMNKAAQKGGGVVFAPEGRYRFNKPLIIPTSVCLRGEWKKPGKTRTSGTILMPYCGKGKPEALSFLTMNFCSGLKNLSIWYPEQRPEKIVEYPATIEQKSNDNITVHNVTLVNSYFGFKLGPQYNELHYFKNVYATALKIGMRVDKTTDIGRFQNMYFSPRIWENSGLPNAPKGKSHRKFMKEQGICLLMLRSDWPYVHNLHIEGYKAGIQIRKGETFTLANGQYYNVTIKDCVTAFDAHELSTWGMTLTRCSFSGDEYGIKLNPVYKGLLNVNNCRIAGGVQAVHGGGQGHISLHQCVLENSISMDGGSLSVVDCDFRFPKKHVELSAMIGTATIQSNRFQSRADIRNKSTSDFISIDHTPRKLKKLPEFEHRDSKYRKMTKRQTLYVATDDRWGVRNDESIDITSKLQAMINKVHQEGGGTIYFPAGRYLLDGQIILPAEVELRGVYDMPHHSMGNGSVLLVRNKKSNAIIMKSDSGLVGLSFEYPEQDFMTFKPYPYMIKGNGSNIYIINVNCVNPYRYIDLFSSRCDNHFVDFASGSPLDVGIRVGANSMGGLVQNCQFNTHAWSRAWSAAVKPSGGRDTPEGKALLDNKLKQLSTYVLGDCRNQTLFNNFAYGCRRGLSLVTDDGRGMNGIVFGHGVDAARSSVYVEGAGDLSIINSQLVSYKSSERKTYFKFAKGCRSTVHFYATSLWGGPDSLGEIGGGCLSLHQASHKRIFSGITEPFRLKGGTCRFETMYDGENHEVFDANVGIPVTALGSTFYYGSSSLPKKSIDIGNVQLAPKLEKGLNTIYAQMILPPRYHGIEVPLNFFDSRLDQVVKDGRHAWELMLDENKKRKTAYFDVTYEEFTDGKSPRLKVMIEYFDEKRGKAELTYDSSDTKVYSKSKKIPGVWKPAGTITMTGSKTWKTAEFIIEDALFSNRCNGKDMRITAGSGVSFALGSVKMKRF